MNLSRRKTIAFKKDLGFERIITEWFSTRTTLFDEINVKTINSDLNLQKQGVDLICEDEDGVEVYIDIKSIAQNSGFHTFSFELAGVFDTKQPGWLLNPDIITDYYMITYHDINGGTGQYAYDKHKATIDNIGESDVLLIEKERVKKLITNYYKIDNLNKIVEDIRKEFIKLGKPEKVLRFGLDDNGRLCEMQKGAKIRFTISGKLPEAPINAVIEKSLLEKIALDCWTDGELKDNYKQLERV